MEDWHVCNDPAELRIQRDAAFEEHAVLRAELAGPSWKIQTGSTRLRGRCDLLRTGKIAAKV
ncbi:hypothetical protein ABT063_16360 [Streptomyces sp. NPDC002838]|uniref:hypothetical protein n=1 Tax=Streptomyces sp. NPDC002838 TaxID=3154436 RepID=UPI00332E4E1D